jgi:DNA-binding beta-propeller fold protein YncE
VVTTGATLAHVIEAPNGKIYVTNAGDGTVDVYRLPVLAPVTRIEIGGMPHGLWAAGSGRRFGPGGRQNTAAGRLDLIDPSTDRPLGTVPVGHEQAQVAVTADAATHTAASPSRPGS